MCPLLGILPKTGDWADVLLRCHFFTLGQYNGGGRGEL